MNVYLNDRFVNVYKYQLTICIGFTKTERSDFLLCKNLFCASKSKQGRSQHPWHSIILNPPNHQKMASMEVDNTNENDNNLHQSNNNSSINELLDASSSVVVEKYKQAGIISNRALHRVLSACRPGIKIVELCKIGDQCIVEEISKVYDNLKAKGQKGICFPTCVSVNEIAGHNSPFSDDKRTLHFGDMVKVDLGCHIDGFCAVVAHTIVLGKCEGKKADAIAAAWSAAQSALRLLKPKNKVFYQSSLYILRLCGYITTR